VLIERYKEVVGTFPAAFFFASTLFVKLTPSAPEAVEEALDALVGELKKART
jgi:hypothetical protein